MSEEQAERGIQSLYEDISVREELIDEEAEALLQWGEQQVNRLAAQDMDDDAFDEATANLMSMMTRMSRLAAQRAGMSPEEEQTALGRIESYAAEVGLGPAENTFLAQTAPGDIMANLQALMAYVAPVQAAPAPESPPASEEDTDTPPPPPSSSFFSRLTSKLEDFLDDKKKPE